MDFEAYLKKDTYTATEVIKLLRITRFTLYKYIYTNKLKAYKVGKKYLIFKKDLIDFLKASNNSNTYATTKTKHSLTKV